MNPVDEVAPVSFRGPETEKSNTDHTNVVPQCIKDLPTPDPSRQSLTHEQLQEEKTRLVNKEFTKLEYPIKRKFRVDPKVAGQVYGLVSFVPSKGAFPDSEGCYGVLRLRGNFGTELEADKWSDMIVRDFDNFAEIDYVYVGNDFPLMDTNEIYTRTTREIDVRKLTNDVVKAAQKEKEHKERKEIEDIQNRERKLLDKTHSQEEDESYDDLDFYVKLRFKKANALYTIHEAEKKMKEAHEVVQKTAKEIEDMDAKHPDFKDEFLARYEQAIKNISGDIKSNPVVPFMKE